MPIARVSVVDDQFLGDRLRFLVRLAMLSLPSHVSPRQFILSKPMPSRIASASTRSLFLVFGLAAPLDLAAIPVDHGRAQERGVVFQARQHFAPTILEQISNPSLQ
jgi:hypothetical protein